MRALAQIKVERNIDGIEGLCVITPRVFEDSRGYFMETYNANSMREAGFDITFVQDNQSMSTRGVLRGLHFQKQYPQTKLVRVIRGEVYDVAVDLRPGSPTYGRYHGELLTEANKRQFLIPRGFAHGFLVLSETAEFCYKCDDFYHPDDEGGLAIATDYEENDFLYDEIGSGLKVNQMRNEKRELFEQLEEYYELLIMMRPGN